MRPQFLLGDIWNGLRRNRSMAISVVLVTMVSMYLLGLGLLAQRQADAMKGYWYDRVQVSIFLCPQSGLQANCDGKGVTQEQRDTIKSQLDQMKPLVKRVYYESAQQAYDRFQEYYKNSPVAGNVKVGDIPESFRVQLSDPTKFQVVVSSFEGAPGVASVQDQEKVFKRLFQAIDWITLGAVFLAILMVICAVLLMATTIRQAAFSRRREIGIMKLVGASNVTIRTPFVVETALAGLVGVGLALGLLWASVYYLVERFLRTVILDKGMISTADVWLIAPWLVGAVLALAVVTSTVTLWRYLRV